MPKIVIEGKRELSGQINISGAKNSAVALIPSAVLSDGEVKIYNVPEISDIDPLISIIKSLKGIVKYNNNTLTIDSSNLQNNTISEKLSSKLRASYYFMGALLSKFKKVEMFFPGGCKIGSRPINFHIEGFKKMGAKVTIIGDKYIIQAKELKGANIYLDIASVGSTINLMLAATKAKGTTIISNAAKEPEIVNVATFLNNMGANISGAGTSKLKIVGVEKLGSAVIDVIPDRIEAGTYIIAGALVGKKLIINDIIPTHLEALISKLKEAGANITIDDNSVLISKCNKLKPVNIKTLTYPGFPTDLGQIITTLLTQCEGTSLFEETLYENRVGHIDYLNQMGADIKNIQPNAIIKGKTKLHGCTVKSTDLRAGAALIIAGLIAEGKTTITDINHILRGYDNITEKLSSVGAKIKIVE